MRKLLRISLFVGLLVALGAQVANAQLRGGTLNDAEKAAIRLIRIDEKIARDVYLTLSDIWGVPIFSNIASSEQKHMDAVLNVISKYKLLDPVEGLGVGEFPDPESQALYNSLVELGSQTITDAYTVGVTIERMDIEHLNEAIEVSQKADIDKTFKNLLAGSLNHLAAFLSHLPPQN